MSEEPTRSRWKISLVAGSGGFAGRFSIVLPLPKSEDPPWILFPGFFYGQGRKDPEQSYPTLGPEGVDEWTHPSWDFALDRGAFPCLLAQTGRCWTGLDWSPHWERTGGPTVPPGTEEQVGCGFAWAAGSGELRLNLPAHEGPRRHARSPRDSATDLVLELKEEKKLSFTIGVWIFDGDRQAFAPVLEQLYFELRENHPRAADVDAMLLARTAFHGIRAWHWVPEGGYTVYTTAFDRTAERSANERKFTLQWHFESLGFVGGFPVACGLLWYGRRTGESEATEMGRRMVGRFCREALHEWGIFQTSFHPDSSRTLNGNFQNFVPSELALEEEAMTGGTYGVCWQPRPWLIHSRTLADACLFLTRCLPDLANDPERATYLAALRSNIEVVLAHAGSDGRFGQYFNLRDRRVESYAGAGGILWIPVLIEAEPLFRAQDPAFAHRLIDAALKAGQAYSEDLLSGEIGGAPEDTRLSPTSEDGYNAILAYAALYQHRPDPTWLGLWQAAADWALTFRKAYNQIFPPRNMLGQSGFRTTGGDLASAQNNCLHIYGMICLQELCRLSRIAGNPIYAERARDHLNFAAQLLAVDDGQWNSQRGMCTEQVYTSDWSIHGNWDPGPHHVQKGLLMGMSHVWCINMFLLAGRDRETSDSHGA